MTLRTTEAMSLQPTTLAMQGLETSLSFKARRYDAAMLKLGLSQQAALWAPTTHRPAAPWLLVAVIAVHLTMAVIFVVSRQAATVTPPMPIMVAVVTSVASPAHPIMTQNPLIQPKEHDQAVQRAPTPPRAAQAANPQSAINAPSYQMRDAGDMPQSTQPSATALPAQLPTMSSELPSANSHQALATLTTNQADRSLAPAMQTNEASDAPIEPPKFGVAYLNNPAPEYPRLSKRAGEEGRVVMQVLVSERGVASRVELAKSSGYDRLDQAAINAVKQWQFEPARRQGKAIPAVVMVPLSFSLTNV